MTKLEKLAEMIDGDGAIRGTMSFKEAINSCPSDWKMKNASDCAMNKENGDYNLDCTRCWCQEYVEDRA